MLSYIKYAFVHHFLTLHQTTRPQKTIIHATPSYILPHRHRTCRSLQQLMLAIYRGEHLLNASPTAIFSCGSGDKPFLFHCSIDTSTQVKNIIKKCKPHIHIAKRILGPDCGTDNLYIMNSSHAPRAEMHILLNDDACYATNTRIA